MPTKKDHVHANWMNEYSEKDLEVIGHLEYTVETNHLPQYESKTIRLCFVLYRKSVTLRYNESGID